MLLEQAWCHVQFSGETVPLNNHPLLGEPFQDVPSEAPHLTSPCLCGSCGLQWGHPSAFSSPTGISQATSATTHKSYPWEFSPLISFPGLTLIVWCLLYSVVPQLHTALREATSAHSMMGQSPPCTILSAALPSLETCTKLHTAIAAHLMPAIDAAIANPDRTARKSNIIKKKKKCVCQYVCFMNFKIEQTKGKKATHLVTPCTGISTYQYAGENNYI